jgi:signal transduction histidine kinase
VSESGLQDWKTVDCAAAAGTAISNLQKLIEESGASIRCGEMPRIWSIEILLVQVFQNLISNAIKYRSEAPPEVRLTAEAATEGWTFSVRDNGIGIDPASYDYIFGVFRRLNAGESAGTGIGLAICKAAVERLGGSIWVESTLGHGSVFRFYLPKRTP